MKTLITTFAIAAALTAPAFAQSAAEESASRKAMIVFNMSNNSAAEIIVGETSMGDVTAAQVSLALSNMSAAERMGFFEADMSTRRQVVAAQMQLLDCDSAAECK
jgi:hypothetical protein